MKFRIAEHNAGTESQNAAWWPADGEWEGETGAEAIQAWADETGEAGEGTFLAIPAEAIEVVKVTIDRHFHAQRVSRAEALTT